MQQIGRALDEYRSRAAGSRETERIPFRGRSVVVEVVELPLEIPLLNASSFRIAPALADHPRKDEVRSDPESLEAQQIVADLVRKSHRHAEELKSSLRIEGQDRPGLITRGGKLINANSRCVLLRDLVASGDLPATTSIRVAVLPSDTINSEELALEFTLQQQEEHKDPYTLVSKLMMIEKLRRDAGMSDEQIAASLREKAPQIKELREVYVLMNRARSLTSTPLPLSVFVTEQDQQQNWLELLRQVREVEKDRGREAANDQIRSWLIAYYSGFASVHQLRNVRGDWVHRDVVPVLSDSQGIPSRIVDSLAAYDPGDGSQLPMPGLADKATQLGLDILGDDGFATDHRPDPSIQRLLDIVAEASTSDPGRKIDLDAGETASADEVLAAVRVGVEAGIKAVKRRAAGTNKLNRPQAQSESALASLKSAQESIVEVSGESDFAPLRPALIDVLTAIREQVDVLSELLEPSSQTTQGVGGSASTDPAATHGLET